MPALYTYYIFISHAWSYTDDYNRLVDLLNKATNFSYKNYSVPKADPCDANSSEKLTQAIKNQMGPAQVVLILAGMWVNHSAWIQFEIDYAKQCGKPLVIVRPWGQQKMPTQLQNLPNSQEVGWNTDSIVSAIRSAVK